MDSDAKSHRQTLIEAQFASEMGSSLRPVMTMLNGDHSWLVSIPRPIDDIGRLGKAYFHILYDPWLEGTVNPLPSWLINIALAEEAAIKTASAVEEVIGVIEKVAIKHVGLLNSAAQLPTDACGYQGGIDAILLGFHLPDHTHEETLRRFDKRIPVAATAKSMRIVTSWQHFDTVQLIRDLNKDSKSWQCNETHPSKVLPAWLTAVHMPGHHDLNFAFALIWTHMDTDTGTGTGTEIHEAILSAPHGTRLNQEPIQAFLQSEPKTEKLAMLHGLKDTYTARSQNAFGAKSGLALYRALGECRYWIVSHSGKLNYTGLVLKLFKTNDKPRTLEWALQEEQRDRDRRADEKVLGNNPNVTQVANGASLILI